MTLDLKASWSRTIEFDPEQSDLSQELKITQADKLGLGGSLWDAALSAMHFFSRRKEFPAGVFKGKRVIELGAGTGAVGITLAALGASVTITDIGEGHLALIKHNVDANVKDKDVTVCEHRWGSNVTALKPPFDVIVAADVVYLPETFDALVDSIDRLSDHQTIMYLAYEKRKPSDGLFFQALRKRFSILRIDNSRLDPTYQADEIGIFVIQKLSSHKPTSEFMSGSSDKAKSDAPTAAATATASESNVVSDSKQRTAPASDVGANSNATPSLAAGGAHVDSEARAANSDSADGRAAAEPTRSTAPAAAT